MIYAQYYYTNGTEACGTDAVRKLDGRYNLYNQLEAARTWARQHGYTQFSLFQGTFTKSRQITSIHNVER